MPQIGEQVFYRNGANGFPQKGESGNDHGNTGSDSNFEGRGRPVMADFEGKLFNLITREGDTGLIFSKRLALTKAMIETMNLFLYEESEKRSAEVPR